MSHLLRLLSAGIALAVAVALTPATVFADADAGTGPQTWAVSPAGVDGPDGRASFDYVVEPDDVYADHVAVRNLGEQPLTVALYAQDAVQTVDGDFQLLTTDDDAERIGAWLELDRDEVTVPARDVVIVPFEITVPADAEPGDHSGGIVAVSTAGTGGGANVQYRVGARIHLRVAGPVTAAVEVDSVSAVHETRLSPFAASAMDVAATLVNTGNVRVSPASRVHVAGLFGWWSASAALEGIDEILPEGAQSGGAQLPEVPPIGPLWVTVDVVEVSSAGQDITGMTATSSRTVVVWAVPWVLVGATALLVAAVAVAVRNLRRRVRAARLDEARRRVATETPADPADAGAQDLAAVR
jgi:hypothetical protein